MRFSWVLGLVIVIVGAVGHAQGNGKSARIADEYLGAWAGSWTSADGGSAGQFEMTLEKDKDGAPAGKVKVSGGEADHAAEFKSLSFDGNKMTGSYDYPPDPANEVVLEATIDGRTGTGTWVLHPRGQGGDVVARGTWTVTKK